MGFALPLIGIPFPNHCYAPTAGVDMVSQDLAHTPVIREYYPALTGQVDLPRIRIATVGYPTYFVPSTGGYPPLYPKAVDPDTITARPGFQILDSRLRPRDAHPPQVRCQLFGRPAATGRATKAYGLQDSHIL